MITVNLLTTRSTRPKGLRPLTHAGCLLATCVTTATYGVVLVQSRSTLRVQSMEADAQLVEASQLNSRVESGRKHHEDLTRKLAEVREVLGDRTISSDLLEAVSRSLTDGVQLTEIKRSILTVQLDGRADSLEEINRLVEQLAANAMFARGPELRSVSPEDADDKRLLRFQIAGDLASVEEASKP